MKKLLNNLGISGHSIGWSLGAIAGTFITGTVVLNHLFRANDYSFRNENNLAFVYVVQNKVLPPVAIVNGLFCLIAIRTKKSSAAELKKHLTAGVESGKINLTTLTALFDEVGHE